MISVDFVLSAPYILPIVPNVLLKNHALVIHNQRIVSVLPQELALQQFQATQHLKLTHHVLLPGLINAHAHTPMNLLRGLADDVPLSVWLKEHIWPAEQACLNTEFIALGSKLAILEMIRGGITCFNDHYFFPDTTAAVATECGIRAVLGHVILNVPTPWAPDESAYFLKAERMLNRNEYGDHIHWSLAPHSPYMVSDSGLQKVAHWSRSLGLPIHMHVHETAEEIQDSLSACGMRPLKRLKNLGLLSERFIAVHMTQLIEEEMQWIRDSGTHVVHCPHSNCKLASGVAPVHDLLSRGASVAIGTDGAASNNALDLWSEIRTAAFIAKAQSHDACAFSASDALKMMTISGARALGLESHIGSLEAKKMADVIAVDLNAFNMQPIYDVMSALIYSASSRQVSHVWIAGRLILNQGSFVHHNESDVFHAARHWMRHAQSFAHLSRPH